ncbi:hypothetical protein A3D05_04695 [Candidatus Gottesmanbacteria bacterium RIFCSPHIGHO2_02_FULL_40_24]|nr:MAG: hypothetical protein A3D05_04695 [Candidatus Gottesmanbacteria bacterium RIFCSPHIGHO2_02_FULL_40_24]
MIKLIKSTFFKESETKKNLTEFINRTKQLSFGRECVLFEKNFSGYQERKQCVLVNSGSSANLAIIMALINLGILKRGDMVGFSALTWSTNVMPLIQLGLTAVPVDVSLQTLNVHSGTVHKTLKRYPLKMLFLTNLLGFCSDPDKIAEICRDNKIILIEDNCEALGSIYKGKKLGNFGLASTFSFYVGHHLSTVEGGAVLTDNYNLASMLRIVRAHGWDRNLSLARQNSIRNRFKVNSTFYSRYTFYDLGFNLRPTEIAGFLGNIQLKYLDEINQKRRDNFKRLAEYLYTNPKLYYPVKYNHLDFISNFAFPLICKSREIRDKLVAKCEKKVEIRPIVGGDITTQPFFRKYMGKISFNYSQSQARLIHEQGLYFGNNPELTGKEINTLIKIFSK